MEMKLEEMDVRALAERLQDDCVIDADGDIRIADHGVFLRATAVVVALARAYLAAEQRARELEHPSSTLARCCSWCEQPYTDITTLRPTMEDNERIKADARRHFLTCSAHPAVAAKEQAESDLAELRMQLAAQDAAQTAIAVRQHQGGRMTHDFTPLSDEDLREIRDGGQPNRGEPQRMARELRASRAAMREWEDAKAAWERVMYTQAEQAAAVRLTNAEAELSALVAHVGQEPGR